MNNNFLLIGLTGKAGAGKDTIAEHMVLDHALSTYALASPIKNAVCTMFNLPMEVFEDRESKEKIIPWIGKSPRYLAQKLGTEYGRELVADDIWLKIMHRHYDRRAFNSIIKGNLVPQGLIITDVRFDNEAQYIRDLGGVIWKVDRKSAAPVNNHVSEAGVSDSLIDAVIDNNGDISGSLLQVTELINALRS